MSRWRSDHGGVSILFAIGLTAVMMFIGLSVDGANQYGESQRVNQFAAEAARAGGQYIDIQQAIAGTITLDQSAATAAAMAYLHTACTASNVSIVGDQTKIVTFPDATHITITLTIKFNTEMLNLFGYNTLQATGTATAVLVPTT